MRMKVYQVFFHGEPNHEGLLVEIQDNVYNFYHITGDPINGFEFEIKKNYEYTKSLTYIANSEKLIGETHYELQDLENILAKVPIQEPIKFKEIIKMKRGIDYGDCRTWVKDAIGSIM